MGAPPLPPEPRVCAVQAGRPDAVPAPRRRRGPARLEPARRRGAPRVHPHQPADGRDRPRRTPFNSLGILPSQDAEHGTEPLLYAATSPAAAAGGYYGPGGRFGLVGPTTTVRPPRRARDAAAADRLWAEAERLTGVT